MQDDELLSAFLDEGRELLDHIEPTLIELQHAISDGESPDPEQINGLFRLYHTLKGSSGFLGLERITQLTHEAESFLDLVRQGLQQLDSHSIDLLCQVIDLLRQLLVCIATHGDDQCDDSSVQSMVKQLHALITGQSPGQSNSTASPTLADVQHLPSPQDLISDDLRQRFLEEGEDILEELEQNIIEIQKDPQASTDLLHAAFRATHTFKGNCGIMGLAELERLAHRSETVLDCLREGQIEQAHRALEDLLTVIDVLRGALRNFAAGGAGDVQGIDAFVDVLGEHLQQGTPSAHARQEPEITTNTAMPTAQEILALSEQCEAKTTSPRADAVPDKDALDLAQRPPQPRSRRTVSEVVRTQQTTTTATAEANRQDVRVDLAKLDALINMVGELVLAESMVANNPVVAGSDDEQLQRATHHLRRVAGELQDIAMTVRMIPLSGTFRKMLRVIHDVAKRCGKDARLVLQGEETEVDKTVIEKIADPLVHIVRNAVDHGLEGPEERQAAGKNVQGLITLEARHEAGEVWILIHDDGRGLDRHRILAKARERRLVDSEAEHWPDEKVFELIFEPGFSTAAQVSDISGRGVGMDVVKKNIERLKGRVNVLSQFGKGTTIRLRLPLTLAIINGLVVRVGSVRYILPILNVQEAFQPSAEQITTGPDGSEMVRVREEIHPVIRLHQVLKRPSDYEQLEEGLLVTVEVDRRRACFFVDELLGQQETVIKGFSDYLGDARGVAGCTILGDGSVALILDVPGVLALAEEAELLPA